MSAKNIGDRINPDSAKNIQAAAAEEAILGLMMLYDEHRESVANGRVELSGEDFFTEFGTRAFEKIMELQRSEGGYLQSLLGESFNADEMGRLMRMEYKRHQLTANGAEVFRASVEALKSSRKKEAEKNDWMADIARRQLEMKAKKEKDK